MIVYKSFRIRLKKDFAWEKDQYVNCEGWYLFGLIPLFVKKYYGTK